MTTDEFERIVTAICQMRSVNLANTADGVHVPLNGVLAIIHSNLHPDDKENWILDREAFGVRKRRT
jgi:hypothetical protein